MVLTEYLSDVTKAIDEYSRTGLILSSELKIDARTEKIGLIKGSFVFINESKLFFTEYLDLRYKIEKLAFTVWYVKTNHDNINIFNAILHNYRRDLRTITWVAIRYSHWSCIRLPCKTSLPWCDEMWVYNCFH